MGTGNMPGGMDIWSMLKGKLGAPQSGQPQPPAHPGPQQFQVNPPVQPLDGYSQGLPMFGRMGQGDLTTYHQERGIPLPGKPPSVGGGQPNLMPNGKAAEMFTRARRGG